MNPLTVKAIALGYLNDPQEVAKSPSNYPQNKEIKTMSLQITVTKERSFNRPAMTFQVTLDDSATDEQIFNYLERVDRLSGTKITEEKFNLEKQVDELKREEKKYHEKIEALNKLLIQVKQVALNLGFAPTKLDEFLQYPELFSPDLLSSKLVNDDEEEEDEEDEED